MENNTTAAAVSENAQAYKTYGTVRDAYQQLMSGVTVKVFNQGMRSKSAITQTVTAADGTYTINFTLKSPGTAALVVALYDTKGTLLKQNETQYDIPAEQQVNFDLSGKPFAGVADYYLLLNTILPFVTDVPLAKMTETTDDPDISFVAKKTGLSMPVVEQMAMAARFETFCPVPAYVWFGILSQGVPALSSARQPSAGFEAKVTETFDALMHTPADKLMDALQKAVDRNKIAFTITAEFDKLRKQLNDQLLAYAEKHPVTGMPSARYQKAALAGLKGEALKAFIAAITNHTGSEADFWNGLEESKTLKALKNSESVEAVFKVDNLTGNHLAFTGTLVKNEKVTTIADIRKLAGYTANDWAALLKKNKIKAHTATHGETETEKLHNYAGQLEASFTRAFPTAAFAARMSKDSKHKLLHHDKVSAFLQDNPGFDLLNHQVGTFIDQNKKAVAKKDAADVTDGVRRIQRVFRLTSSYDGAITLLNDNIHSAHQVFKMGKANFVKNYSDKLGRQQAEQIFDKANTVHANAIALTSDLKSMVDASAMNAFPDFGAAITTRLATDLPDLDSLFGHGNYCECSECSSVYGAPAYLTDILHYLDKRHSTLPAVGGKTPSVKDLLLMRRPDIGDIDLGCDNANTEVPYIDIACEIMEDYIASPVAVIANSSQALLLKGVINTTLLATIKAQLTATGQTGPGNLLTAAATVSDPYTVNHLQSDGSYQLLTHWIIRDAKIVIKATATNAASTVEIRVLHQTLLSKDTISTGPEYVNTSVYTNFLNTAKTPFTLPFDLYETEGELHLEKLGIKKAGLVDVFRKEDHTAPGTSNADVKVGYASLGISLAEQALIFTADPTHQSLYWGNAAATTTIQVDVFEGLSGLTYSQVYDLIQLQFINPNKDTVIEHDSLAANTNQQRLLNVTPAKLDAMHRFLRLWRKTSFTMYELDAIIMSPAIGQGSLQPKLALQLHQFVTLQQKLQLSVFQLLAFYQNIDTTHSLPDCLYNQLFQDIAITNPVSANFSIASATAGTLNLAEADKPVLAAILQVSLNDVNALIARFTTGAAKVSLALFSSMYRYAQLAQALTLSVTDLLNLTNLVDAQPFQNVQSTCMFIQKYNTLKSSGFSIDELNYILRHQDDASHSLVPAADVVTNALTQLQNDLLKARTVSQPAVDANGVLLSLWLSDGVFNWDPILLNRLVDILNTTDDTVYVQKITENSGFLRNLRMVYHDIRLTTPLPVLPLTTGATPVTITFPAPMDGQLVFDSSSKSLTLTGYMSAADQTALLALSTDAAYQSAINALYNKSQQTDSTAGNIFFATATDVTTGLAGILNGDTASRFAFFINKLAPVYKRLLQQNVLVKDISNWFSIDKTVISQALNSVPAIYTDLTTDDFVNKVAVSATQTSRYQFIAKLCFTAGRLKLTAADLAFLLPHAADVACLTLQGLPLAPVSTAATTFPAFEALVNLLKFQQYYPAKVTDVVNNTILSVYSIMLDAINQGTTALTGTELTNYGNNLVKNLTLLTGWNATDLTTLIGPASNIITLVLATDIKSVPILMRLHQRITMQQQLGIAISDAFAWTKDAYTAADVAKIKQTLKQGYSNSEWVQVSQTIQNTLREKKRDALIAYLLANPGTQPWKTADDLYNYFLLDVQMCSCQPTSRIVQATNTVQLFVQRCFMGLESNILVDTAVDPDWNQWQWMKNFRVWQANMKVFLYPENYIEPELLPADVKSSFLTELESELMQNEVTAENVETVFKNYVDKLSVVSRLEMKGMWYDDPSQTLHVFGRTFGGDPKVYYYRKFIEGRRWTPWEKIDLDVSSEYIMPVVYNNHVYLFWAIIKDQPTTNPNAPQNWQIQLAYSEYKNGKWSPKKISNNDDSGQIICAKSTFPDASKFFFTPLDMPIFDYSKVHKITNPAADLPYLQSILDAISKNGTIVINCCYYSSTVANAYVKGFQLDIAKGYPVIVNAPANLELVGSDGTVQTKNLVNMLETEINTPPLTTVPSSNTVIPDQSRGKYANLVSFQMSMKDRNVFISRLPATDVIFTGELLPFFYQDHHRSYFVRQERTDNSTYEVTYEDYLGFAKRTVLGNTNLTGTDAQINTELNGPISSHYFTFYHPMIANIMQRLFVDGVNGLMARDTQLATTGFNFATYYSDLLTTNNIYKGPSNSGYPTESMDFSLQLGYGLYNWELFYHAPLMIAERLSQNQQFDDADRWYRYIFNPMDSSDNPAPGKYWNTKPFFETTSQDYLNQRIDQILLGVNNPSDNLHSEFVKNIADWRNNPFQPHYIAEYRTVTYQKVAVMKYVGHLIRYGDYLFGQDTMESVNQATQLYLLASEILGPKPEILPSVTKPVIDNYYQLEQKLDDMSDAVVNVENLLPLNTLKQSSAPPPVAAGSRTLPGMQTTYFCMPVNENMVGPTGYWNVINDRLFKLRHCLNIDGTVVPAALFAATVNPSLLVRATAAGIDLGSILNDMSAQMPAYRFNTMLQRAMEICGEVKSLGSALLSVLEKKDSEAMSLLRAGQELKVLNAVMVVKQAQINEAQLVMDGLDKQHQLLQVRDSYYSNLIGTGYNNWEKTALGFNSASAAISAGITAAHIIAAVTANGPDFTAGSGGLGVVAVASDGGSHASKSASSGADILQSVAGNLEKTAGILKTVSDYSRRAAEWQFQADQVGVEFGQLEKQIEGAQLRWEIANTEVKNQQLVIDNAGETNDFMQSKFTNEELFNWMITQTSATYFQVYQLAYSIAKKAERCFRYELGLDDSSYINFGYWDSLKKGLLAGDQLSLDLKQMEMAYYDQNKRELELTKPISLSQLDPVALLKLKTTRQCFINLPEELFDMDYPGHYMRRIKSVSITIPCITGPYTTISCKLTLAKSALRASSLASGQYQRKATGDDPRFRDITAPVQSIATSGAQNDSGMFELNFRDERYLPFEGAGAISLWHLELPAVFDQFDYDTISDVILNLKYTARDGGAALSTSASDNVTANINKMLVSAQDTGLMRVFSAKTDLSTEWYKFLNPASVADDQVLTLNLDKSRFPIFVQNKAIKITSIELVADGAGPFNNLQTVPAPTNTGPLNLKKGVYGDWQGITLNYNNAAGAWLIKNPVANPRITPDNMNNMIIIVHYTIA